MRAPLRPPAPPTPAPAPILLRPPRRRPAPPGATWRPVFALPNLQLRAPGEVSNFGAFDLAAGGLTLGSACVAVVHPDDARVQAARARMRGVEQLLTGFSDEHGTPMRPAVLLVRDPHPRGVSLDALRAFRNVAALSVILRARVAAVRSPDHHLAPRWADTFDFYPAQVDAMGELSFGSAAVWSFGGHRGRLVATTAPYLDVRAQPLLVDHFLHQALGAAWRRRFERARVPRNRESQLLFRSLEAAYAAASVPLRNGGSLHDWGAQIGSWVSALEMLVRADGTWASEEHTAALLNQVPWYERLRWVRSRRHTVTRKNKPTRATPAARLLQALYQARNDFLHGNDVSWRTLTRVGRRAARGATLAAAAPVLYRLALHAWLARRYVFPPGAGLEDALTAMGDELDSAQALRALLRGGADGTDDDDDTGDDSGDDTRDDLHGDDGGDHEP